MEHLNWPESVCLFYPSVDDSSVDSLSNMCCPSGTVQVWAALAVSTQTVDIKELRGDIRFNVIQTNTQTFYFPVMSVAAAAPSLQKYVNIFFSKGQIFNLSPPTFDMTVEVWCQVYTVKINESMLCLTGFYTAGSHSVRGQHRYNEPVMRRTKYSQCQNCFVRAWWWVAAVNDSELWVRDEVDLWWWRRKGTSWRRGGKMKS